MALHNNNKSKNVKEMQALKEKAIVYYAQNGVPKKMEEILNTMINDNPNDVYGHVANYFESLAQTPTISKVLGYEVFDAKGAPTVCAEIWGVVKNSEQRLASLTGCTESVAMETMKMEEIEAMEAERRTSVAAAIDFITGDLGREVIGRDPIQQREFDTLITDFITRLQVEAETQRTAREAQALAEAAAADKTPPGGAATPQGKAGSKDKVNQRKSPTQKKGKSSVAGVVSIDEPKEQFIAGSCVLSVLSLANCAAASYSRRVPLYKHVASLLSADGQVPEAFLMPLPMVTALYVDKTATGKLKCIKEFMVMPGPLRSIAGFMKHLSKIISHCAKGPSAAGKATSTVKSTINDQGCVTLTLDRPEQGLDLIMEALSLAGLVPGEDVAVALNCAAHRCYDADKGKYELVTGTVKTADELVDYWVDLLTRYTVVTAIIDPLRKQDTEAWMRLCERVSQQCHVIGDVTYHRPGLLKSEPLTPAFKSSAVVLRAEHVTTVSDLVDVTLKMRDADIQVVMSTSLNDVPDNYIIDLAVGLGARYVKLAGASRGEKVAKLTRLVQVESELGSGGHLAPTRPHVYPLIRPPTPPPAVVEGDLGDLESVTAGAGGQMSASASMDTASSAVIGMDTARSVEDSAAHVPDS